MSFNRARYVTICQQVLVTAATVAVGLSAAGVMTLTIVEPGDGRVAAADLDSAVHQQDETFVETDPVQPRVREIKIAEVAQVAQDAPQRTQSPAPTPGPAPRPQAQPAPQPAPQAQARTAPTPPAAWKTEEDLAPAAVTEPQKVDGFATVGVVWDDPEAVDDHDLEVQVRTRTDGRWSEWTVAQYHDEHQPSGAEASGARPGTDALIVGQVDDVQVRTATRDGRLPEGMTLAVIDPGKGQQERAEPAIDTAKAAGGPVPADALADADLELSAMAHSPRPTIYSRAQWGADERLRDGSPSYGTIKTGFVHHTVNANTYTAAEVPGIIRSIYKYHTQTRGWSDIGYNFLVDRFGRIWEGRYGGVDRPVIGAHTLGYNEVGFAMSAIGNYETAAPTQATVDAYSQLMAWKLSMHNIDASATRLYVKNRYLAAINGHRDAGQTACPGRYLYARIGDIRTGARRIQLAAQAPAPPPPPPPAMPAPTTAPTAAVALPGSAAVRRLSIGGTGWPDVVLKSPEGDIRTLATNGLAGYRTPVRTGGNWRAMDIIAAVGDVNGDRRGDVLARVGRTGYTSIYPGLGNGQVSTRGIARTGAFRYANMVVGVGDWNGDGRRDVVSRDRRTSSLYLHRGRGAGQFAARQKIAHRWPYVRTMSSGDVTGDRRIDLIGLRATDKRLVIKPGRRGTTVATAMGRAIPSDVVGDVSLIAGWGDQVGDRTNDVVVQRPDGLTYVRSGNGRAAFPTEYGGFPATAGLSLVTAGPMDRGRADLVGRDAAGYLVVVPNNNLTNHHGWLAANLRRPDARAILQVGDWNRDGRNDIITREGDAGRTLMVWPGLGDGRFGQGMSLGDGWATVTRLAGVGDVTGDGFPDLAGSTGGPTIIWPGNGAQGIKAPQWAPPSLGVFNAAGTWSPAAMFLSATGTFVPAGGTGHVGPIPGYPQVTGVGDANADGIADVIARDGSGTLWMLPGKTSGGLGPRVWVASGFAGYQVMG